MPREAWVLVKAVVSDVYPDQGLPGPQPPMQPPVYPSHPIHSGPGGEIGGPPGIWGGPFDPPRIWGGGNQPFPTPPIYIPITPPPDSGLSPEHPIYIPVQPPGIWGGGNQPFPTPPITNPGDPGNPGGPARAELVKKIVAAVQFWTGNLPPVSGPDTPQPV